MRGVIGPNGAGKSTFFKMLTCELPPTSGRIIFHGRDITGMDVAAVCQLGLTKSYQVNQLFARLTRARERGDRGAGRAARHASALDLLRRIDRVPGLTTQVESTLALVGLSARADVPVAELAYGEKRRLEIGLALAASPSLLLLDEPLAGMSPRERAETVQLLKNIRRGRTLVVVEHDMDAVFELAERITVLHEGACWPRARRPKSSATASCRKPISAGCGGMSALLEVEGINSYYGDSHILFDVSLRVEKNEVVALLGRNGAGKSTTLKSLMGAVRPRSGRIMFDGTSTASCRRTPSPRSACSWCRRSGAFSAA